MANVDTCKAIEIIYTVELSNEGTNGSSSSTSTLSFTFGFSALKF